MRRNQQRGAALITVIIMVTVVIAVLASIFHNHGIDVARSTKIIHSEQAALLALSGESWAIDLLKQDDAAVDTLLENWAFGLPLLPVEGGRLTGTLSDLQSKFNVNNLQRYTPARFNTISSGKPQNSDPAMLQRLATLAQQPLDLNQIAAIIDWTDTDDTALPGGAEQNEYLLAEPAYRPSNTMLISNEELTLITALPTELLALINPYITTLPTPTTINVNTASKEVLQMLDDEITEFVADNLIATRNETPWNDTGEFSAALDSALNPINAGDILKRIQTNPVGAGFGPVGVSSNYFQLDVAVQLGTSIVELTSLIYRNNPSDVVVLARTLRYVPNTVPNVDTNE